MTPLNVKLIAILLACVVPYLGSSRKTTKRVSRGAGQASFQRGLADKEAIDDARSALEGRDRIVVLPLQFRNGDDLWESDGESFMNQWIDDLQYVPSLIAVDAATGLAASKKLTKESKGQVAKQLDASLEMGGFYTVAEGKYEISVSVLDANGETLATTTQRGATAQFYEVADRALLDLLKQLERPTKHAIEIQKVPTTSSVARRECDRGFVLLYESLSSARGRNVETIKAAERHARSAIKADPRYMKASILLASCLDSLNNSTGKKQELERAGRLLGEVRKTTDELTRLELLGDLAGTQGDDGISDALDSYDAMLEISPTHARALWSTVEALIGIGDDASRPTKEDLADAGNVASMLIVAHPHSSMAKFLKSPPSE